MDARCNIGNAKFLKLMHNGYPVSLRVFCAVAELRLCRLADRLGSGVKRLEQRLGTCLLNRTRWQVTLTGTGTLYFEQIRQMLVRLDE